MKEDLTLRDLNKSSILFKQEWATCIIRIPLKAMIIIDIRCYHVCIYVHVCEISLVSLITPHTTPLPPHRVNHSKNAIVKPQGPSAQETKRDVDEAMKRVKEAMMDIEARVGPEEEKEKEKPKERSRSRYVAC